MKWMATLVSLIETDLSLSANDILVSTRNVMKCMYIHIF